MATVLSAREVFVYWATGSYATPHYKRISYGGAITVVLFETWSVDAIAITRLSDIILRSEEHTSELQSLMRISYAVFCLKKKHTMYLTSVDRSSRSLNADIQLYHCVTYSDRN